MTSYTDKEPRLSYNSNNQLLTTNWENILFQLGKKCSLTSAQNFLSKALLCTLLMFAGVIGVWAQEEDISGTYYIGNYGKNADANNKYYLCPTEGWYFYTSGNGVQKPDNGQPFLTTYKCLSTSGYDTSKAVWIIEKHPTEAGCYYIKQKTATPGTYKYIVSNGQINGSTNANRMRVHIEEISTAQALEALGDLALFELSINEAYKEGNSINLPANHLRIKPHAEGGRNGSNIYLVANNGNWNQLDAQNSKTDGPDAGYGRKTGGIISIYELEQNAGWYLEDAIKGPEISFTTDNNTDNNIKITGPTGTTKIYYTTNGDRPTVGGATTTEVTGTTVSFDPADGVTIIKAIAIVNGETTNVSTFTPPVLLGTNHKRLIQSQGNGWDIDGDPDTDPDFHFYMIPGDPSNDITKVNTTSLFRPTMEWYFLNAGAENDVQYYYIVNNAAKDNSENPYYLCWDGTNVCMSVFDSNDADKFKFSIVASPTAGSFNISPHADNKKFINKNGNVNAAVDPIGLRTENTTNSNQVSARWKFVLPNTLNKTAPFYASNSTSTRYYKIENIGTTQGVTTGHFIVPPTGSSTFAEAAASSDASANWYFEEASSDDWQTYYYIRNAKTGDYLYFPGTVNSGAYKMEMRHEKETGENAPKYQFIWARTTATSQYYIVPVLWKDKELNYFYSFQGTNNATTLNVVRTRTAGFSAWEFDASTYKCATPTITFNGSQYVISAKESDAKIKYTIDNGTNWVDYSGAFDTPLSACTIKAYAYRSGDETDKSDEATFAVTQVATPEFDPSAGNSIAITCETAGAKIYYTTDGTDPTTSSTLYTHPLTNADVSTGTAIKAIAVKAGSIDSEIASSTVTYGCAAPIIRRGVGKTFTLECTYPASGVTIYYTTNGSDPTTSSTVYNNSPVNFASWGITVKAIAIADGYNTSVVSEKTINEGLDVDGNGVYLIGSAGDLAKFVTMVNDNQDGEGASAHYRLTANVSGSGIAAITRAFTGIFEAGHDNDGNFYKISGLSHALFNKVGDIENDVMKPGTVKNVMLDNVVISSSGTNVGAIANEATGAARIYNCGVLATSSTITDGVVTSVSSTISGSTNVGSIVGLLDGEARVINCFSFANITGGSYRGGIVGYNNVEGSNSTNPKTMVMNCMYYGNIDGGNRAPIYNGYVITNDGDANGVNNFNYFWSGASYVQNRNIDVYNCALAAETRFLQRFEFFRHMLNSNRELAAWWATNDRDNKEDILKWVMEPSQIGTATPYPILKVPSKYYPSVVNIDAEHAPNTTDINKGRNLGTLTVTISGVGSNAPSGAGIKQGISPLSLPITDKDPEHFNFNYYKVQLPYYNDVGTGNYTKNKVVTGWKVTVSGGSHDYTTGSDATATVDENGDITLTTPYNFADRKSTGKDDYGTSGRVFSQGAYFDVPDGVTSISIEPYWGDCVYVADEYMDVVYKNGGTNNADAMTTASNVTTIGGGKHYVNDKINIEGADYTVYKTMSDAVTALNPSSSDKVYDKAIVLVGNVHSLDLSDKTDSKPYTIMSIDLDKDNEPDYSYILRFNGRTRLHPVRVDFLNVIGLGMAQKSYGGTGTYNLGIMQPLGWFESTNTALFRFTQFEYDFAGRKQSPMILQGGVIEQWVTVGGAEDKLKEAKTVDYYHVGGNVWFKEFHIGVHQDKVQDEFVSPHPPISITGGDFKELYLTGLYNTPNNNTDDNAECYINGGHFGKVAGTGMQGIGAVGGNSKGDIIWQIDNADIDEFYAGGINAAHIAEGNLTTVISNSRVDQFCGGPKFGNMNSNKIVVTNATNCTFRTFFGAGYGGNSYNRRYPKNQNNKININWNSWVSTEYTNKYDANYKGVETRIDYQFLPMSSNIDNVCRLFVDYVSFSLATTYNVTSKLTGCTITKGELGNLDLFEECTGNFYGGGSLGKVAGNVKSTLTNCTIAGNVFGAGYSASLPKVSVMKNSFQTQPYYDENLGAYLEAELPTTDEYTWVHLDNLSKAIDPEKGELYTTEKLTELGTVTGKVTLNIENGTTVTGSVYGGGESSDVYGKNTSDEITSEVEVNIEGGSMTDVYGGGYGANTVVGGDIVVNIGAKNGSTLSGSGTVSGNVYGGSALGAVNASSTKDAEGNVTAYTPSSRKTTNVNIYAGAVTGSVFGGGLGRLANGNDPNVNGYLPAIAAHNFGNTFVTMEGGTVSTGLYGGANTNGVLKGKSTITISGGTAGTLAQSGDPNNVVFGGGYGAPTLVEGDVEINLGAATQTTAGATINGSVYGGGALGNVNTSKPESTLVFDATKTTKVNLFKGTVKGNVYGGGLGQKEEGTVGNPGYKAPVESFVGGDVTVELNNGVPDNQKGCIVEGAIFGCNNANGTPKGNVTVHVYKTQNAAAEHITNQEGDTNEDTKPKKSGRYDVAAVYGGGNQAAYYPTVRDSIGVTNGSKIQVIIEGCDRTSIEYVYGGGNAAPVPATDVTINSSFEIYNVFGGGNGQGEGNPGADVGIINKTKYDANNETGIYGTGIAETKLIGGTINTVYGGSNTKGNVRGRTSVSMPSKNDNCPLNVTAIYGAGQNAEQSGDVALELGCGVNDIYGGAKDANIQGNVNIVITGGHHPRVFGGNDTSGTIHGTISVNIEETNECDPITIGELYLGGNNASYSTYGYYVTITNGKPDVLLDENDEPILDNNNQPILKLLPRTSTSDTNNPIKSWSWNSTENKFDYTNYSQTGEDIFKDFTNPVLNVISCTSIGKIFGGGLGSDAIIYGSPTVNLNMIPGIHATDGELGRIGVTYTDPDDGTKTKTGGIFGGGNKAKVVGNTTINIGTEPTVTMKSEKDETSGEYTTHTVKGADIRSNIYGGGEEAEVTGNTQVNILAKYSEESHRYETVTLLEEDADVTIAGSVFGAGKGENTDVASAIVRGNSTIQMGGGWVKQNIYGGGELSCVGDFTFVTTEGSTKDDIATYTAGGTAKVNFFAGKVGPETQTNPATYGHVYGAGKGDGSYPKFNYAQATDVIISGSAIVEGSVFGGSENGHVRGNTNVAISGGTIGVQSIKKGGATVGNVYGGGQGSTDHFDAGIVKGNTNVTISDGIIYHNIYGGGAYGSVGTITLGTATYVPGNPSVANMPTEWGTGTGKATITITGGTIGQDGDENGMIFGSSRGEVTAPTGSPAIDPNDHTAWVYDTEVTIGTNEPETGPTIFGSVYGSGENGHVFNDTDVKIYSGIVGVASGEKMKDSHNVEYDADDYPYRGNVYGGGCGEDMYDSDDEDTTPDMYNPLAGIVLHNTNITIAGGHVVHNVFGAGALGSVGNKSTINIRGGRIGVDGDSDGNVYGAARGDLNSTQPNIAHVQDTEVNIAYTTTPTMKGDGTPNSTQYILGSVFGGGEAGIVKGNVAVNMSGGYVVQDVYGGGALADTNTDNWNSGESTLSYEWEEVTGLTTGTSSVEGLYAYDSEHSTYTEVTDATATAEDGIHYYKNKRKTTVTLSGGIVGNVYGGGLGRMADTSTSTTAVAANVYGDVTVKISNTAFTDSVETFDSYYAYVENSDPPTLEAEPRNEKGQIPRTGRAFGCNNYYGTPKGNVSVIVYSTKHWQYNNHQKDRYEMRGVYGGGNLANYNPVGGKKPKVEIHDCANTSIEKVYGGGNSADVNTTDVTIFGCFDIRYVFGGGNGADKIHKNGIWQESVGANVTGDANVLLKAGTIHDAFLGSDTKGTVANSTADVTTGDGGDCDYLKLTNFYGASKRAPVDGDVKIRLSACGAQSNITNVFAGSYDAQVRGDITLNVTSGVFENVFGGNDREGYIGGNITINIEEVEDCKPIIIHNLYGGGYDAAYPGNNAKRVKRDGNGDIITPHEYVDFGTGKITINVKSCTRIDKIHGGGFGSKAEVTGDTEVNVNMLKGAWAGHFYPASVDDGNGGTTPNTNEDDRIPNTIGVIGDIFGGGEDAKVTGNSTVNIGTETEIKLDTTFTSKPTYLECVGDYTGTLNDKYKILGANITGNIYGGGDKADVTGNTQVNICAKYDDALRRYKPVTEGTSGVTIAGDVFGAGKGVDYNVKTALVHGNSFVYMGGGNVKECVYGGGELANVGDFNYTNDKPTSLKTANTGTATVHVFGGKVGPASLTMPMFTGHVFGAGKGKLGADAIYEKLNYVNNTDVTISGTAFVKGSVYGGAEDGHVLGDTDVKIEGGQIGCGYDGSANGQGDLDRVYTTEEWAYDVTSNSNHFLYECNSWPYGKEEGTGENKKTIYASYDMFANETGDLDKYPNGENTGGGRFEASDGHTFYGNVFGGGSGFEPYAAGKWLNTAGEVYGSTHVTITGGHILTNIYGGNELTDVKGDSCVVIMSGGTLGVPRTLTQIEEHPVTCYLFGAGKGDQRTFFNTLTNVENVRVRIDGDALIYGSIFGGGEDGHVLGNTKVGVYGGTIGTWGTSYKDGNVFGGGRGYSGEALTAGAVCGNVDIDIKNGRMLGNIYGGGRLGSVGCYLAPSNDTEHYGELIPDGYQQVLHPETREFTGKTEDLGATHGYVTILIRGGVIGNDIEYKYDPTNDDKDKMPFTLFDSTNRLMHTKGGNVFAGGMGRREKLNGAPFVEAVDHIDWRKLGNVKSTKLTISDNAWIKGNVFGGGEFGAVQGSHSVKENNADVLDANNNPISAGTEIIIKGGTIGTMIEKDKTPSEVTASYTGSGDNRYTFGSVYGGGYGTEADVIDDPSTTNVDESDPYTEKATTFDDKIKTFGALVYNNTYIKMSGSTSKVRASIYGGGEMACVKGNTYVNVTNGEVGIGEVRVTNGDKKDYVLFGSWRMGNVYGGGKGSSNAVFSGLVAGNSNVMIKPESGATTGYPKVYHNVYGGGAYGSVGTYTLYSDANGNNPIPPYLAEFAPVGSPSSCTEGTATVTITGGQIGINGWDNGMVNGSGRGDVSRPASDNFDVYDRLAWVNKSIVKIGNVGSETVFTAPQPQIKGSLYGGGENGHNYGDAEVYLYSGTIGTNASSGYENGNVYGSGCGTDTYTDANDIEHNNRSAGFVQGNATVNIAGGHVLNSVFGGGSMASVGIDGKKATLNISNGTVEGSIYGGPKGNLSVTDLKARTKASALVISGGIIKGSAFGGGYAGIVEGNVEVSMTGGTVNNDVYGGGSFADTNTNNVTNYDNGGTTISSTTDNTTTVRLTGGTILHDAYGGALGRKEVKSGETVTVSAIPAKVYGNVLLELNGTLDKNETSVPVKDNEGNYVKGCIVDRIFGCNNLNGTPKGNVEVRIHATQNKNVSKTTIGAKYVKDDVDTDQIEEELESTYLARLKAILAGKIELAKIVSITTTEYESAQASNDASVLKTNITNISAAISTAINEGANAETNMALLNNARYDVKAVYGGGNLAPYEPNDNNDYTKVRIYGCDVTSIYQAYGGGNAASTPATNLTINSAYEIYEAFGGGNGNDPYDLDGKHYLNPGANVGYYDYTHFVKEGTSPNEYYNPVDNTASDPGGDASTKENREANYGYGTGIATTNVRGGTIHTVFGGSNKKGNIRQTATSVYESSDELCTLCVGETYGAGKNAPMDGDIDLTLDCVKDMPIIYGGAKDADVNANITLNITNGTFEKVFGGNNTSGKINGSITVNVEERGCQPIIIDELYGGGYLAPYSIYGYDDTGGTIERTADEYEDLSDNDKAKIKVSNHPRINIISATHIGTIYGGGYRAAVVGDPRINVNMTTGRILGKFKNMDESYDNLADADDDSGDKVLPIGDIGTIFGGGNEANIDGDTYVEIGTGKWINRRGILETLGTVGSETVKKTYIYNVDTYNDDKNKWGYETTTTENEITTTTFTAVEGTPTPARNAAKITDFVFGGGNEGDITGNTYITMENGSVGNRIYGGGNIGNVGTYQKTNNKPDTWNGTDGKYNNTGVSNVTITGGMVGPAGSPVMNPPTDPTFDKGHVFGAGRGKAPSAEAGLDNLAYVYDTNVTIGGTALVKGSVFGGSENGHVRHDTHVNIQDDCQIGCGKNTTKRHEEDIPNVWESTYVPTNDNNLECYSWPYEEPYAPYDPNALSTGKYADGSESYGMPIGSDGHTFYGGVFGGGSGYYPYKDSAGKSQWIEKGGEVEGDTYVAVTGGHILTSLYGGNEMTNVLGNTYVVMTGGTLGVPRTLEQIAAHPVTCYLFGAGKGDQRTFFNTLTNVENAYVYVLNEARIYGSVFGGGEDGHIHNNAEVNIGKELPTELKNKFSVLKDVTSLPGTKTVGGVEYPLIGTTGTSYVDGNVFGAGRGFSGDALTAGSVGGNVEVNIEGGTMLGSIYGGGRLASVGIDFTAANDPTYGQFHEDEKYTQAECDEYNKNITGFVTTTDTNPTTSTYYTQEEANAHNAALEGARKTTDINPDKTHGHVTVNINGGTIGNDVANAKYGGNVYGGSMGRLEQLNGSSANPLWAQLAQVKTTTINISGNTHIKRSVYGGGEMGTIRDDAFINISGTTNNDGTIKMAESPTIEYNVFGGGYGSEIDDDTYESTIHTGSGQTAKTYVFRPIEFAGCVGGDTHVNISGGLIKRTVYGGGEMATVGLVDLAKSKSQYQIHRDANSEFALSWPYEYSFIQETGGTAHVNITGGRIGLSGKDKINSEEEEDNGDIYGGGKGIAGDQYDMGFCGNVRNSVVTIDVPTPTNDQIEIFDRTPSGEKRKWTLRLKELNTEDKIPGIAGSVYGGAEDGHVLENATINITNGYIGHSVYGGGKGKGTYKHQVTEKEIPCITAGKVYGNTTINMTGGWIMRNIYGGGNLGSVGKGNYAGGTDDYFQGGYGEKTSGKLWESSYDPDDSNTSKDDAWHFMNSGKTNLNITGGTVGYMVSETDKAKISVCEKDDLPTGNIFGGCRGQAAEEITELNPEKYPDFFLGYVNETDVNIGGYRCKTQYSISETTYKVGDCITAEQYADLASGKDNWDLIGPRIYGSVYGGAQDGHVRRGTNVIINKGEIGIPYNDTYRSIMGTTNKTLEEELDDLNWLHRGNIYGGGSGIGKYEDSQKQKQYSSSAGSVTHTTNVTVNNGITGVAGTAAVPATESTPAVAATVGNVIYRNVYGGGSLASVSSPFLSTNVPDPKTATIGNKFGNTVNINGAVGITDENEYNEVYGGEVYGAGRGDLTVPYPEYFAISVWTKVHIMNGAHIMGNVFGGGDNGVVTKDSEVIVGD